MYATGIDIVCQYMIAWLRGVQAAVYVRQSIPNARY